MSSLHISPDLVDAARAARRHTVSDIAYVATTLRTLPELLADRPTVAELTATIASQLRVPASAARQAIHSLEDTFLSISSTDRVSLLR